MCAGQSLLSQRTMQSNRVHQSYKYVMSLPDGGAQTRQWRANVWGTVAGASPGAHRPMIEKVLFWNICMFKIFTILSFFRERRGRSLPPLRPSFFVFAPSAGGAYTLRSRDCRTWRTSLQGLFERFDEILAAQNLKINLLKFSFRR